MELLPRYQKLFNLTHYDFQYVIAKGSCPRCRRKSLLFFPLGTRYWLYCTKCGLCSWAHALNQEGKNGNNYQRKLHNLHERMIILCQTHYKKIKGELKTKLHLSANPCNVENRVLAPIVGLGVYKHIAKELYADRLYLSTNLPTKKHSELALFLPIEAVPGFLVGWLIITEDGEWKAKAHAYKKLSEWVYLKIGGGEPTIELNSVDEGLTCYLDHLGYDSINIVTKPALKQFSLPEAQRLPG